MTLDEPPLDTPSTAPALPGGAWLTALFRKHPEYLRLGADMIRDKMEKAGVVPISRQRIGQIRDEVDPERAIRGKKLYVHKHSAHDVAIAAALEHSKGVAGRFEAFKSKLQEMCPKIELREIKEAAKKNGIKLPAPKATPIQQVRKILECNPDLKPREIFKELGVQPARRWYAAVTTARKELGIYAPDEKVRGTKQHTDAVRAYIESNPTASIVSVREHFQTQGIAYSSTNIGSLKEGTDVHALPLIRTALSAVFAKASTTQTLQAAFKKAVKPDSAAFVLDAIARIAPDRHTKLVETLGKDKRVTQKQKPVLDEQWARCAGDQLPATGKHSWAMFQTFRGVRDLYRHVTGERTVYRAMHT